MRYPKLAFVALAAMAALTLAACGGGGGGDGASTSGGVDTGTTTAPPATPSENESSEPGIINLTAPANASVDGFDETELSAPADTPFTIHFDNQDAGIPHNVAIFEGTSATGAPLWAPPGNALLTGPDTDDYHVAALPAGTYTFACLVHLTTMTGTLTVA